MGQRLDIDTLTLLRGSLRELLESGPHDIAGSLSELGWDEVVADDPAAATTALFEEQGAACVATRALDGVVTAMLGLSGATAVVWPLVTSGSGPSSALDGGALDVRGIALRGGLAEVVVPTADGLVTADGGALDVRPVDGIDPDAGWVHVSGRVAAGAQIDGSWTDLAAAAQRALASELVGVCRGTLALATAHVTTREQFGRPIGSYQSVRHRLAEAHAAIAGAAALTASAWADGRAEAAAGAKAVAGWAQADVARHAMQVSGAMGLSWEHDLHRYVKRGYALDALLGSARMLARQQGAALLAGLDPPRVGSPLDA